MTQGSQIGARMDVSVPNLSLRPCTTLEEFDECVRIQREVWKFSELETVPSDVFIIAQKTGGQIIGAFDGSRQIGFTLAFLASQDDKAYLHSHFAAVLPGYQGSGIGRRLKLAQREDALQRGIRLIEWTFDPLALMNAHFNLNRLGAVIRRYIPNFYGVTSSPLHGNIPTDRFIAEWWLESDRVKSRLERESALEESTAAHGIIVPRNVTDLLRSGSPQVGEIQAKIRGEFLDYFNRGYTAVGISFSEVEATYLLQKNR